MMTLCNCNIFSIYIILSGEVRQAGMWTKFCWLVNCGQDTHSLQYTDFFIFHLSTMNFNLLVAIQLWGFWYRCLDSIPDQPKDTWWGLWVSVYIKPQLCFLCSHCVRITVTSVEVLVKGHSWFFPGKLILLKGRIVLICLNLRNSKRCRNNYYSTDTQIIWVLPISPASHLIFLHQNFQTFLPPQLSIPTFTPQTLPPALPLWSERPSVEGPAPFPVDTCRVHKQHRVVTTSGWSGWRCSGPEPLLSWPWAVPWVCETGPGHERTASCHPHGPVTDDDWQLLTASCHGA